MPDIIYCALLAVLVIFSCLAHGSVTIIPLVIVESLIAVMTLLWLVEMAYQKKLIFVKTGFLWPLSLFFLIVIFQLLPLPLDLIKLISPATANLYSRFMPVEMQPAFFTISIYPNATINELIKFVSYLLIFLLVLNRINNRRQIHFLLTLIVFFGVFISIFGLLQKQVATGGSRSFGPFIYRNNFAGYINIIIPLALGFYMTDMPLSKRIVYAFVIGIMTLALFSTTSRGGILVYFIILSIWLLFSRFNAYLKERKELLVILFVNILAVFIFFLRARFVWERVISSFGKGVSSLLDHGYLWRDLLRICNDFITLGTGLGTFGAISPMYKTDPFQVYFIYAHNDFLQLLSEVGAIGFIAVFIFFTLYMLSLIKSWFKERDLFVISLTLGGFCSILGVMAYSLIDFNLKAPANALLLVVIMALIYNLNSVNFKNALHK
jgi:O-antigen ligase